MTSHTFPHPIAPATPAAPQRQLVRGFTLIEVMIVMAVLAILAAVAMPSYKDYIRRGEIQEAFTNLSSYRLRLEQFYQDNRNYGSDTTCAGAAAATLTATELGGEIKAFTYTCTPANNAQEYTVTATGASGQAVGHVYTINHLGNRATTKFKDVSVNATCWLSRSASC